MGMWTCCKDFNIVRIWKYLIVRVVWDIILVIVNCVMVGLAMMPVQTFFLNAITLFLLDGYLNLVIYSYLKLVELKTLKLQRKRSRDQVMEFVIEFEN